jgi:hypothetical protein
MLRAAERGIPNPKADLIVRLAHEASAAITKRIGGQYWPEARVTMKFLQHLGICRVRPK